MLREGQLPPRRPIGAKRLGWRLRDLLSWLEVARQSECKDLHRPTLRLREPAAEPRR
jgi:hypothetical protein